MNSGPCSGSRAWAPITSSSSVPGRQDAAVLALCQEEPAFRERLLVESREALLRDFSAKSIAWYLRMHRLADPAAHEVVASQHAYLAVLATAPSTAVGLAQDMLKRAVGLLDADAMIDAGAAVLTRAGEAGQGPAGAVRRAQDRCRQRNRLSRIVGEALEGMPLDLAPLARKLVDSSDETQRAATDGEMGAREEGAAQAVTIPPPRREPLPDLPDHTLAIVDDEALHALIRAQFEGAGDGAELLRLFAHLASRPQLQLPEALRHRAAEIIESVWDERNASPRRCWPPRCWAGMTSVSGLCPLCRGQRGQAGSVGVALQENTFTSQRYDVATGDWTIRETWTSRSGYQYLPTHAPLALLAGVFHELRASRMRGEPFIPPVAVPEQRFVWERVLAEPGAGTFARDLQVLGEGPKPFWMAAADASTSPALDVADVPADSPSAPRRRGNRMATTRWCNGRPGCCDPTPTRWPRTSIRCCARR